MANGARNAGRGRPPTAGENRTPLQGRCPLRVPFSPEARITSEPCVQSDHGARNDPSVQVLSGRRWALTACSCRRTAVAARGFLTETPASKSCRSRGPRPAACPFRFSPQRRARHAANNPPIPQLSGRDMDADEVFGAPAASCIGRPTCRCSDRDGAFGIGTNSTGGTGPRREWVQRSSDSQSLTIPVAR